MRALILLRHGQAEASAVGGDRARQLTPSGRLAASIIGARLAAASAAPDVALVSDAARTTETWKCAGHAFPAVRVEIRGDLYDAEADEIAAIVVAAASDADILMVVGHNPGLQAYAVDLLRRGGAPASATARVSAAFPPATAVLFAVDAHGRASLEAVFDPRDADAA